MGKVIEMGLKPPDDPMFSGGWNVTFIRRRPSRLTTEQILALAERPPGWTSEDEEWYRHLLATRKD